MDAWEIFKSVFCKELFNKPKNVNATDRSNFGERCFIIKLMKKYMHKFIDIIISGSDCVIRFIKQSCYKKPYDSEFNMSPQQAARCKPCPGQAARSPQLSESLAPLPPPSPLALPVQQH